MPVVPPGSVPGTVPEMQEHARTWLPPQTSHWRDWPLLSLWRPQLAGVGQPLAGEWAARRSLMESLTIPVGYGVELSTLLDTFTRHGLGALAQVDLGSRAHRHQADHDLALMAAELMVVAEARRDHPEPPGHELHQFVRDHGEVRPRPRAIPSHERPPVVTVASRPGMQRSRGQGEGGVR